jgi:hypothetical protein
MSNTQVGCYPQAAVAACATLVPYVVCLHTAELLPRSMSLNNNPQGCPLTTLGEQRETWGEHRHGRSGYLNVHITEHPASSVSCVGILLACHSGAGPREIWQQGTPSPYWGRHRKAMRLS